jgi:hypothetical protein
LACGLGAGDARRFEIALAVANIALLAASKA